MIAYSLTGVALGASFFVSASHVVEGFLIGDIAVFVSALFLAAVVAMCIIGWWYYPAYQEIYLRGENDA